MHIRRLVLCLCISLLVSVFTVACSERRGVGRGPLGRRVDVDAGAGVGRRVGAARGGRSRPKR